MGRIPTPPGFVPVHEQRSLEEQKAEKGLSVDTLAFILDRELHLHHREDPNVIGFIKEYLQCRNVSQAAKAVGLHPKQGEALKRRQDIHRAIVAITDAGVLKYGYDAAEVVERVKEIVGVDPGDLQRADGTFITALKELAPETRRAIKKFKAKNLYDTDPNGMKVVTGVLIEVEFWDKMKGIELLGREKDIFKETTRVEHDMTKNMASVLLDSKRRADDAVKTMIDVTPVIEVKKDE